MNKPIGERQNKDIVVVMRGPSTVIFPKEKSLCITSFPTHTGSVRVVLTTRWIKHKNELPGNLWIEISGRASSLEEALLPFANAGIRLLPTLSLSSNAAIGLPDIEVGFDNTPGVTERDYFQSYIPEEQCVLHTGRFVNIEASKALYRAIAINSERERIGRAASQYKMALDYWRMGQESLALSHLWMALEALTKAKIRKECIERGVENQEQLAECLSIELRRLDPYIRKEILLKGDAECYSKAKKASDGFEHGFLEFDKIRDYSMTARNQMASYVRNAILDLCDLNPDVYKTLTKKPYDKPLGHWPIVKYLRGKLIGKGDRLGAPGKMYPFVNWKTNVEHVTINHEEKEYNITITDKLNPELAEGIKFQPSSAEVWEPD